MLFDYSHSSKNGMWFEEPADYLLLRIAQLRGALSRSACFFLLTFWQADEQTITQTADTKRRSKQHIYRTYRGHSFIPRLIHGGKCITTCSSGHTCMAMHYLSLPLPNRNSDQKKLAPTDSGPLLCPSDGQLHIHRLMRSSLGIEWIRGLKEIMKHNW